MLYLSGCISKELIRNRHPFVGVMYSPDIGNALPEAIPYAADNGCFSQGERFDLDRFLRWLDKQPRDRALFAVAPDVVADAVGTLKRSLPDLPKIRDLGFFAAFVGQDGATDDLVPWDEFDCWFIGGSTEWKLSAAAFELTQQALSKGKWAHMGRVNSLSRFQLARTWGCHSVDGTFLAYGPSTNWPRLVSWLESPYNIRLF